MAFFSPATRIYLKYYADSGKLEYTNEKLIKPEFRVPFAEWYEEHVTVMNLLEQPMTERGTGFYPSYDVLRLGNLAADKIDAGAVDGQSYRFEIQTQDDPSPVVAILQGDFIQTWADLIRLLENNFPNVEFTYNKASASGNHSITVRSKFKATRRVQEVDAEGNTSFVGTNKASSIHIFQFGEERDTPLGKVVESDKGDQATHAPIQLAEILPQHLLLPATDGTALQIARGRADILAVPNVDVNNVQELVDYINNELEDVGAVMFRTYDSTIPTYLNTATVALHQQPLVFAIAIYNILPTKDEYEATPEADVTNDEITAEESFGFFQVTNTFFGAGDKHFVSFNEYELGIGSQFAVTKRPNVASGLTLFEVLQGTSLSTDAIKPWIPEGMDTDTYDPAASSGILDMLKGILETVANPFIALGKKLVDVGIDAAVILAGLAAAAADGVLAAVQALAKLADTAIALAAGAFTSIAGAIAALGSAVVDFIKGVADSIITTVKGWFDSPPSVDDRLKAARDKVDNPDLLPYLPEDPQDRPTTDETQTPTTRAEKEPITSEGPIQNPRNPVLPSPPLDDDRGGLKES